MASVHCFIGVLCDLSSLVDRTSYPKVGDMHCLCFWLLSVFRTAESSAIAYRKSNAFWSKMASRYRLEPASVSEVREAGNV